MLDLGAEMNRCPRCGGWLLPARDAEVARECLACGWAEYSDRTKAYLEVLAAEVLPTGGRTRLRHASHGGMNL